MKLTVRTRLPASVDAVAAILNSPENAPRWQRDLVRMEVVRGGPNQVGSLARLHYVERGRPYVMEDELLECDADRRWVSRVSGSGFSAVVETKIEDSAGGTLLRLMWDGRPDGLVARLLFPFLRPAVRRRLSADLDSLERLVRTGPEAE